jgi:hypothetical protein
LPTKKRFAGPLPFAPGRAFAPARFAGPDLAPPPFAFAGFLAFVTFAMLSFPL